APSVAPAADAHDLGMAAVDGPPAGSAGPDPAAHEVDLREVVLPEVARPEAAPQSPHAGEAVPDEAAQAVGAAHEVVAVEAPPLAPAEPASSPAEADVDYFEVRRRAQAAAARRRRQSIQLGFARLTAALAGVVIGLVLGRTDVVRILPQTASLYAAIGLAVNLRGLAFEGVKAATETQDGLPVLVVEGAIRNVTRETIELPRLRFAARGATGELHAWTAQPGRVLLAPAQAQPFQTRLASPPSDSQEVLVRFVSRRDLMAAAR
ncbi:MAG TPA: hypothetical protein VIH40_05785, partial [Xanthobacteraceae bacterium]